MFKLLYTARTVACILKPKNNLLGKVRTALELADKLLRKKWDFIDGWMIGVHSSVGHTFFRIRL